MNAGWTWISSPLLSGSTIDALGSVSGMARSSTDLVKDQYQFASYVPGYGWFGGLATVSPHACYKMRLGVGGDFVIVGTPVDTNGVVYDLNLGWSWFGWPSLTTQSITVFNDALEDEGKLSTLQERIKSQYQFTSFVPDFGWFGDLQTFQPGLGYMVKLSQANRLLSFGAASRTRRERQLEPVPTKSQPDVSLGFWLVEPDAFEFSMCVVSVVVIDGIVTERGELAAFVDDQLRGVARPSYYKAPVGPYQGYKSYNLMAYGHLQTEGAMVKFQYRHPNGHVITLAPSTTFIKDSFLGSVVEPFVIGHATMQQHIRSTFPSAVAAH